MSAIRFDLTEYPLVIVTFVGTASSEEFEAYLTQVEALLARRQPYALVMDATESARTPEEQRRRQAAWMKEHQDDIERYSRGTAFVFKSGMMRFVLSTIFMIQPLPGPYTVVSTRAEGVAWARRQLATAPA